MCTVCGHLLVWTTYYIVVYCLWPFPHLFFVWTTLVCVLFVANPTKVVLLEFQYYKQKLFRWMYNPGETPLQKEPF